MVFFNNILLSRNQGIRPRRTSSFCMVFGSKNRCRFDAMGTADACGAFVVVGEVEVPGERELGWRAVVRTGQSVR